MCRRLKRRALLGKADRALGLLHPPSQRLVLGLPRGYVLKPSGEIALDPDEGVRQVIGLVFAVFERRRSVSGLLRYLVDHESSSPTVFAPGRTRERSAGTDPTGPPSATCSATPPTRERMSTAGATTMVVSGCQASRTVGDASCAIRSAGRCCIAGLCRLT